MTDLNITTLGQVSITYGERVLTTHIPLKAAAILIYGLRQGRAQTREHLAALLWPESSQERASGNLRMALAGLREHVPDAVEITRTDIKVIGTLDAAVFDSELDALKAELSGTRKLTAESLLRLDLTVRTYGGEFMAQFALNDSPAFEAWILSEREAVKQRYIGAVGVLIDAYRTQKRYREGIDWALRLLAADPLNEETHRRLMRLYVTSGDRTSALAQFETCQSLLWDELGVEPEDDTIALYEDIASGKIESAPAPVSVTQTIAIIPPTNLPAQMTPFMGRDAEVTEVVNRVSAARLVTLLGMGGLGKTRLALRSSEVLLTKGLFPHGVFFVDLSPLQLPAQIVNAVAAALELTSQPLDEAIGAFLKDRKLLLVLDNFEHMLDGVEVVEAWLRAAPGLRVLATSREPLRLYGENLFDVPVLPPAEAAALFSARLSAVTAEAVRVPPERIAALCERLECWPLAIELAAGLARTRTVDEIYSAMDSRLGVLETTMRGVPERHRTLFKTIDYSFHLLPPEEQTMFRRLSVFAGGWTPDAAQAVTGQRAGLLDTLADKGLIRRERTEHGIRRFTMLETLREFGATLLATLGESEMVADAHLSYFAGRAERAGVDLLLPGNAPLHHAIAAEMDNFRSALQHAYTDSRHALAECRIVAGIGFLMFRRGQHVELLEISERALRHREVLPPKLLAGVLAMVGHASHMHDKLKRADEAHKEALEIYHQLGDKRNEADMLRCVATRDPDGEAHIRMDMQALDLATEAGDRFLIAAINGNLSTSLHVLDRVPEALEALKRGTEAAEGGLEHCVVHLFANLAALQFATGAVEQSLMTYRSILPVAREFSTILLPIICLELADAFTQLGRYDEALEQYHEAVSRRRNLSPSDQRRLDLSGAFIAYRLNDLAGAQALITSALAEIDADHVPMAVFSELLIGAARVVRWMIEAEKWSDACALFIVLERGCQWVNTATNRLVESTRMGRAEIESHLTSDERRQAQARADQVEPKRALQYVVHLLPGLFSM
ncbi:MAG: hypothetical protein IPK52_13950 [Chloroflexi bacterium]|nr:hypothetical protein [Chloroflexota bacterium]